MRCAYCSERKGKRECPALGSVCSRCCGQHRRREILCPADCAYLPAVPDRDDAHRAFDRAREALQQFVLDPMRPWGRPALAAVLGARKTYEAWEQDAIGLYLAYGHEDERGRRPVDVFLQEAELDEAERAGLRAAADAVPALVEVHAVRPGEGLELVDLVDGGPPRFVHERALTTQVCDGSVFVAWRMDFAGRPELLGVVPVPPAHVRVAREAFSAARARLAAEHPSATPASWARRAAADAHRALREAVHGYVPRARTLEGHEVVPCWAVYEVRQPEPVLAKLGDHGSLLPRGDGIFLWMGAPLPERRAEAPPDDDVPTHTMALAGPDGRSHLVLGHLQLRTVRLTLTCESRERLAEGRRRLEELLGGLVRHCFDQHESLAERVRRGMDSAPEDEAGVIDLQVRREPDQPPHAALERWLREHPEEAAQLEARAAARARALETTAEASSAAATPAAAPDRRSLEPLPHERLRLLVPGIGPILEAIARDERSRPGWERRTIPPDRLGEDRAFQRLLLERGRGQVDDGLSIEFATNDAQIVGANARYAVNHELHLRKTFWADDALAWALHETELDVPGGCLRLPFAAAAFVFTDPRTRELADSLLELERLRRRRPVTRVTVYVLQGARTDDVTELALSFLFDREATAEDDDDWPYLLCRELVVRDGDRLDTILDSRPGDPAITNTDPVFRAPELRKLVHLVVNALLYATSAGQPTVQLPPSGRRPRPAREGGRSSGKTYTDDDVFFLPGTIDIGRVKALRSLEATESGRTVLRRFMVRGHWRRPAQGWKDQRLRWIEPYWKGPDLGMIIERDYRLRP